MTDATAIDQLLPQTQCQRCGYDDCRAYAEAVSRETADINRCPPGGLETLEALAALYGRAVPRLRSQSEIGHDWALESTSGG